MTTPACIFPTELIIRILHYAHPRDIVRWRTVSKWFCDITRESVLWTTLYANAPFPRPPGPPPSQSIASLERTLVKSARLAQSWTTRPMRDASIVKIQLEEPSTSYPTFICGRWLVSCESQPEGQSKFVLYDVDADAGTHARQVFWEQKDPVMLSYDVCSMTSTEGQFLVYVLLAFFSRMLPGQGFSEWKLLEFRLNNESGKLHHSATVDPPRLESNYVNRVKLHTSGKSPFIFIPTWPRAMVFDTRTRVFYALPEFDAALVETLEAPFQGDPPEGNQIYTCHIFLLFSIPWDHLIVIQVFTLPPDGSLVKSGNPVLRLTHEGIADYHLLSVNHFLRVNPRLLNFEILKSSVDPVTGTTNVGLLVHTLRGNPQFMRTDLTLPEPSAVDVLPLTVEMQHIDFPTDRLSRRYECFQYIDVSNDGYVRGFSRTLHSRFPRAHNDGYLKFIIDTTQDQWVLACGESPRPEWSHIGDMSISSTSFVAFDGMRGKLCFVEDPTVMRHKTIVIVDIE